MKNRLNEKLEEITTTTVIVGVDIAKSVHWARFVDYRGMELGKAISFKCNRQGFESIVSRIKLICNNKLRILNKVVIGMEPTGHYWKTLANYLMKFDYKVVCVNPYHTKKAKELDDNSQTKSDKKDALTIARLVKDGRFFNPYLPQDIYADLRTLSNTRVSIMKRYCSIKNSITAILDEYFPEIYDVFKKPLEGKASRQILKSCPFPKYVLAMTETEILVEIKKVVKKTVGMKKVRELIQSSKDSIGVEYGIKSTNLRLQMLLEELEVIEAQIAKLEISMERRLGETGYAEQMLSIKGIGIITAVGFLGEVGDPLRFQDARQIANYAGYNLIEDSSGKSKSGTCISKRGRSQLRGLLYQMAFTMVGQNEEMKELHKYLTTREKNPLKKKQSLVVVSKKIITVIYSLLKKQVTYDPALALGEVRRGMMKAA
jgi:transposase